MVPDILKDASQEQLAKWKRMKEAELYNVETHQEYIKGQKHIYGPLQKGTANKDNFMWNTVAEFTERKTRPRRKPDFVSRNKRTGKVSSEYWYTKDGVIRGSDHWGPGVSSCDWSLDNIKFGRWQSGSEIAVTNKRYGVAKWSDFTQKTRDIRVDGKIIGQTNFENTTGKEAVKIGGKHYLYDRNGEWFEKWWEDTKKSIDYIVEVTKFNEHHDPKTGRFTNKPGGTAGFTPASSRDEAVKYAKNALGMRSIGYSECDLETINSINKTITDIQAKYPEAKGAVKNFQVTELEDGVMGLAQINRYGEMEIRLNGRYYNQGFDHADKIYKENVADKFHPQGTDGEAVIWHEYGHALEYAMAKKKYGLSPEDSTRNRADAGRLQSAVDEYSSHGLAEEWTRKAAAENGSPDTEVFQYGISRYAMKNFGETFAEAFADVNNSDWASTESVLILEQSGLFRGYSKKFEDEWSDVE